MQLVNISEVNTLFNFKDKQPDLTVDLVRDACKILDIPFIGGRNTFVLKNKDQETEILILERSINLQGNFIILYSRTKESGIYAYYNVIAFYSDKLLDLKKILKLNKVKAFI